MQRKAMDIYGLGVRNNFLTYTADVSYTKKTGNTQPPVLFSSLIFCLLLFCLPAPAYAEGTGILDTSIDYRDILLPILLLLVAALLVIIGGLVVRLRHRSNQLRTSREYLVRYITYYLELKKQVPDVKEPYPFGPSEITPKEFIKVMDNMLRRIMYLSLFVLFALPLAAQNTASDSTYTFRFIHGKEMFYVAYRDNARVLDRLILRLDSCRDRLSGGYLYVSVTSYVPRGADEAKIRRMGYLRNSHVKSELITRAKLTERMFVTDKVIIGTHADGLTDVVVVTFTAPVAKVKQIAWTTAAEKVVAYLRETQQSAGLQAAEPGTEPQETEREEAPSLAAEGNFEPPAASTEPPMASVEPATASPAAISQPVPATEVPDAKNEFLLRANLLRWATLTPDLGVEWRIDRRWSVLLNGTWTSWSWDGKNRRYALWEVSPEVCYYIGKEKRGYVGAMYHAGQFNYKLGDTGKQGDLMGGGVTGGYLLRLNRSLALDFSLGIGCTHAEYDKYAVTDGVRVKRGKGNKNYWGVNHAGITLVWQLK
ncbi:DUF3575 domain-containing protein [Parabacteroides pacaensis]|uniref:DUF3575 domain-containing protein n=1 Tax=Parabacteroides pacaensis TaxID=2086575 RepID=UPI002936F166|nr:DUF3575 domain-containing protein [Parabacteroides pacaensis]